MATYVFGELLRLLADPTPEITVLRQCLSGLVADSPIQKEESPEVGASLPAYLPACLSA